MSEFLLIVPPGWDQLDWGHVSTNVPGMDAENVKALISAGQFGSIGLMLGQAQLIPTGVVVAEAKLLDDSVFLVRLEPVVEPT